MPKKTVARTKKTAPKKRRRAAPRRGKALQSESGYRRSHAKSIDAVTSATSRLSGSGDSRRSPALTAPSAPAEFLSLWWSYPLRLATCRSPLDLWREHIRLSLSVLMAAQPFGPLEAERDSKVGPR